MRPLSRLAALSALLLNACYPPGDGKAPPLDEIYFPTGAALDRSWEFDGDPNTTKSEYLYIANSDFDLQYRSSSLISYKLDELSKAIPRSCNTDPDCTVWGQVCDSLNPASLPTDSSRVPSYYCVTPPPPNQDGSDVPASAIKPCGELGEREEAAQVLYPGRCNPINPTPFREDSVGIGAFATDVIWRRSCDSLDDNDECVHDATGRSRLFIPVRGDSTLHWIDVLNDEEPGRDKSQFDCGQFNGDQEGCDAAHRAGDSPDVNNVHIDQPPEPFAIDATDFGEYVVVTNQTQGSVSLYRDASQPGASVAVGPKLVDLATGLPFAPVGVATVPKPKFAVPDPTYEPSFLVTYRSAAQIDLLRAHKTTDESTGSGLAVQDRYNLRRVATVPINANSLNFDQRGIAIDDSARVADYDKCQATSDACGTATDCEQAYELCLKSAQQPSVFAASISASGALPR